MLRYTEEHEWLKLEGEEVVVGITEYAAEQLGDLVFVELPEEGTTVAKGDEVVTSGGLLGKVSKMGETHLSLEVAAGVEVQIQRSAVVQVLPKGSVK